MQKILFVTGEAAPLVKTGGLGDVSGSLPAAIKAQRRDVRIILPAYRDAMAKAGKLSLVALLDVGAETTVRILEGTFPGTKVKLWLIDSPLHFDRPGGPYAGPDGHDWPDNADRYAVLARVVEKIAFNEAGLNWQPDVVHCNDWQTGLIPALISQRQPRPATVFTIHNLAYQGRFSADTFTHLATSYDIPNELWGIHGVEFHGSLLFMKGGLTYADMLNTVSPTYAREICTPEFGYGLDGLLNHRSERLAGILNGVDYSVWNPASDPFIEHHYDVYNLQGKMANKTLLQKSFGLPVAREIPLIGMVGRLVEQKGGDLVLDCLDDILETFAVQIVVLGTGDPKQESAFRDAAERFPEKLAVNIGFSEELAHLIEAGADMFLMPSRYEPCGLNQIYSLQYGTVPIVRRTGGLADTVVDVGQDNQGTGFLFVDASARALQATIERAIGAYHDPGTWQQIVRRGMIADFSWEKSARDYLSLYKQAIAFSQA
jgi:starch synthase